MSNQCSDLFKIVKIVEEQSSKNLPCFNLELIKSYLNKNMYIRRVKKDGSIAYNSDRVEYVQYVIFGTYFTYRIAENGKRNLLSTVNKPQWVGLDKALDAEHANITESKVLTECIVLDIRVSYLKKCLEDDNEFTMYIIKNLLTKMSRISAKTNRMVFNDAKENLAFYILEYWNTNYRNSDFCEIKIENFYIAEEIGITIRTLYRAINELKKEGMLNVRNGNILVSGQQIQTIREKYPDFCRR